jgi:ketosteroid isomerase-like protein
MDQATLMGQLTKPKKVRKPVEASGKERVLALASGSDVEKANLETTKKGLELWNARDLKGLEALYTADATFADQTYKADIAGAKKIMAHLKKGQKAFSDAKLVADKMWAAGDWVVVEATFTGTNDGVWKEMGIAKKTGKSVNLHEAHVIRFQDGKVKEHWLFANGMAMAGQLGLLPPPKADAGAPAKADEKAATKDAKADEKAAA